MTMPNKDSRQRPKTSLVAAGLLVSVVLNLFLIGVLAGHVHGARHRHFGPMALAGPHGALMGEWLSRYLEPADATAFRDALQPQAAALKQAQTEVRQATQDVATAFEQEPADPAALQAALDRLSKAKADVNDTVGKVVQDAYAKLSPDGRHRLAELTP